MSPNSSPRASTEGDFNVGDPEIRNYLERYVRRRIPQSDAEDVIQSVLCAALEAHFTPGDRQELRKWMTGVARHKIAAYYQKTAHEKLGDPPEVEASPAPIEASSLMRWAERQATMSEARRVEETLDWMARESDGEPLEEIALEARVPATSVRQRVSRMRRFMRARWVAEWATVLAGMVALAFAIWWLWGHHAEEAKKDRVVPDPSSLPRPIQVPAPQPALGPSAPSPIPSLIPSATPSATPSVKPRPVKPVNTATPTKPKPNSGTGSGQTTPTTD